MAVTQRGPVYHSMACRWPSTTKSSQSFSAAARDRGCFRSRSSDRSPRCRSAGRYRLIDIPISNCLHADIRRIFVLTQFNSASLNRHITQTYRMDLFSQGFVEILAAEQTPDNPHWFQGTADAVRQAARHFARLRRRLLPDSRRRSSVPDGLLASSSTRTSIARADITIAAQAGDAGRRHRHGHLPLRSHRPDRRVRGKADRRPAERDRPEHSERLGVLPATRAEKPFVASMGVYVFSRDVLLEMLANGSATDFGREIIPSALGRYRVNSYLFRGYWADVGTVAVVLRREHHADASAGAPFKFYDPHRPIYTHPRFLPGSRIGDCTRPRTRSSPRAAISNRARSRIRSSASARSSRPAPRSGDRSCSAPTTTKPTRPRPREATIPRSASAGTSCSTASSWTRTRGSATARGW